MGEYEVLKRWLFINGQDISSLQQYTEQWALMTILVIQLTPPTPHVNSCVCIHTYIHIVHNETSAPSCSRGLSVGQANVCERGKLSVSAHTQPSSTMPLRLFVSTSGVRTCILRSSDLSRLTCYTLLIHSNHEIIRSLIDMLIHSDHEIIRSLTCYISYTQFCVLLKGPGAQDNCSSYTDCMETEYVC